MADRADRIRLFAQPVVVLAVVVGVLVWATTRQLDDIEQRNINFPTLTATLPNAPATVLATFPFSVEVNPTPGPSSTPSGPVGGIQVIGS